jgi:hypothetical protein
MFFYRCTDSSASWVFSSELSADRIGQHSVFDPNLSKTFERLPNATWQISYGDASFALGTVGYDTVDVGGSTVQRQAVELATRISNQFVTDQNSDGLLGLAFGKINTVQPMAQKTFFENVMDDLTEPVFTVDLEDNMGKGNYEFGNIDQSKYKGDIHYVDVDNSGGFWQFDVSLTTIGDSPATSGQNAAPAIADTGTSLLYLSREIVEEYYSKVESVSNADLGVYIYPCNSTLPSLGFKIGDYPLAIQGEDMTYLAFDPAEDGQALAGMCMGGLQEGPRNLQILGDMFLKQFFAVFDGGQMRFGIAEKN